MIDGEKANGVPTLEGNWAALYKAKRTLSV
jgi:hypothetical protein